MAWYAAISQLNGSNAVDLARTLSTIKSQVCRLPAGLTLLVAQPALDSYDCWLIPRHVRRHPCRDIARLVLTFTNYRHGGLRSSSVNSYPVLTRGIPSGTCRPCDRRGISMETRLSSANFDPSERVQTSLYYTPHRSTCVHQKELSTWRSRYHKSGAHREGSCLCRKPVDQNVYVST